MANIGIKKAAIFESLLFIYIFGRILTIPTFSYRISLYRGVPLDVFVALAVAAIGIPLVSVYSIRLGGLFMTKFLLAITILPFSVVKFLYLTRDSLMHIGRLRFILANGAVPASNVYPSMHIVAAVIKQITGLSPTQTAIIFVVFGTITLAALITVSIQRLSLSPDIGAVFLFFGMIAVFSRSLYNFAPWGQLFAIFLLMVIFFITFQVGRQQEWSIALLLIVLASNFTHPLTSLAIVGSLTISSLLHIFRRDSEARLRPTLPVLTFVALVTWVIHSPQIKFHIRSSVVSLLGLGSGHSSTLGTAVSTLSSADVTLIDAISTAVARYGFSVGVLGFILVILALRWVLLGQRNSRYEPLAVTVVLMWIFGVAALVLPIPFGAGRLWLMAIVLGLLVAATDFQAITHTSPGSSKQLVSVALIGVLLLGTIAGATVYHSSFDRRPSSQIIAGEYEAAEWLFANRGEGEIMEVGMPIRQMIAYIETSQSFAKAGKPEPHFAATRDGRMEGYLIVAPPAERIYTELYPEYPEAWSYTPEDYRYLETGAATNRIYTSGNTTIYLG